MGSYVLIDLAFLGYPRLQTWWSKRTEEAKFEGRATKCCGSRCPDLKDIFWCCCRRKARAVDHVQTAKYTYAEIQAKNQRYEYNSWGGGPVDDFLEFALMF